MTDFNPASVWETTAPDDVQFPKLSEDLHCDVLIIGGGITGLTTALLLSEAGKKVVLLEARKIGLGTTGRSTGNLYVTVDENLSKLKKKWNAKVVKAVVTARATAINAIESTVLKHKIDCNFKRVNFNLFVETLDDAIEKKLEDEFNVMREADVHADIVSALALPFPTAKALTVPNQAQFHPLKYVRGLAKILGENCRVFEHSPIVRLDEKHATASTYSNTVTADQIVMATHTPKGVYKVQTLLHAVREEGVAALVNGDDFPDGIYWSAHEPKHSIRTLDADGKRYALVIGNHYKTGHDEHSDEGMARLEQYLRQRINVTEMTHRWGAQAYRAADDLPYIGKHSNRLFYMTGFATDGLTYGTLAAMMVSDMILGKDNPWRDVFSTNRFDPIKSAKEFVHELSDNLLQYMRDLPGNVDAGKLDEIKNNEADVIERNGEKLAVYRDESGALHAVSAVCTHMKCVVNWNTAERSWDCPCHGSRFDVDGKVIEGPALLDLPKPKSLYS